MLPNYSVPEFENHSPDEMVADTWLCPSGHALVSVSRPLYCYTCQAFRTFQKRIIRFSAQNPTAN